MYSLRNFTPVARIPFFRPCLTSTLQLKSNMSTSGALYSSASLTTANAQPFSLMEGKLDPMLLQALRDMKFDLMTPVQSQVLVGLPSLKSDW